MLRRLCAIPVFAFVLGWTALAAAQSRWDETVVTVEAAPGPATEAPAVIAPGDPETASTAPELPERSVPLQDLPGPLDYDEIVALNQLAASATVPVRATFQRDPLLMPTTVQIEGVATLVDPADGPPVLVTAFALVDGASAVEVDWEGETISVQTEADARFGLAVLEPSRPLRDPPRALPVLPVEANEPVEAFTTLEGSAGAAVGAGEAQYGYYQVNTLGVTLGYPLINRRGELVGVGSHRYPVDGAYSLSVPAAAVARFLDEVE